MKKYIPLILIGLFVISAAKAEIVSDSKFPLFTTKEAAQHHCSFDVIVWLNTKTDTYNLTGPKPGDPPDSGAYMCQRDADQMDYHAEPSGQ